MKRIGYSSLACSAVMTLALVGAAFATPVPNSAIISERIFNDCALSTLTSTNLYPASISINDVMHQACVGNANLHSWSYSEDGGATPTLFVTARTSPPARSSGLKGRARAKAACGSGPGGRRSSTGAS